VLDIDLPPSMTSLCRRPKFGLSGAREFTSAYGKPLLGGIIKPKTGINVDTLLDIVKALVDGGVNFIKEDEIMSNPACCRLSARLPRVMEYLDGKRVIYAACINSDFPHVMDRAKWVHSVGGNAVHVNFWSGMGTYRAIRELDLPLFLFFQKSGDKILTHGNHDFHISWNVICKLAGLMGCDFIHAGMWGGYLSDDEQQLKATLKLLQHYNVVPSLSCGMHPGLIEAINKRFGVDYMANVGGAIHGHPGGTLAGAKAMRQAIDGRFDTEYYDSLKKWPKVPA
jgi:ribulose-bisphosphate carboxylase large chain